jgi:glucosamine-6-phosphate deaminase
MMNKFKITVAPDESTFDRIAAWRIIGAMLANPRAVIGLSTGQTTKNLHAIISEIYRLHPFDTSQLTIFGIDEVTGVPREYDGACYTMLKTQLVDALGIPEENFIMPPTISDDWQTECEKFSRAIQDRGGIDFLTLGLGTNGHLGFNQPGSPFESSARLSQMDEVLEARVRREISATPDHKLGGITLGIGDYMRARKIMLVAKGDSKADIVQQMLLGAVSTDVPGTILQLHPCCEFILDTASAKHLKI